MSDLHQPADADARKQALDPARSFIVQAPAGSGKTEILIRRMLVLLSQVDAPEEIVALTFTRKAAGEMRARVLAALASAADGEPPADPYERDTWQLARAARARDAACGWALALQPARLRVMTIDALCALLVQRMPLLSRHGGAPAVLDDAAELYREAARATLALLDEGDAAQADAVGRLLLHLDNRGGQAEDMLVQMLQRRDQWIRHVAGGSGAQDRATLEAALAGVRAAAMARARERAAPVGAELLRLAAACAAQVDSGSPIAACAGLTALPPADESGAAAWLGLVDLLLTADGNWRKTANRSQGVLPQSEARDPAERQRRRQMLEDFKALVAACARVDGLDEALRALRRLPPSHYDDAQWGVLGAVIDVLRLAAAQLQRVFVARGAVDHAAVAQAALAALGTEEAPTDLLLALDARIRHLLVDEFQDTSVSQFELLARLTAGWSEGDGRSLFVVGDPMQSIYGFREAEVGLFLRAWHAGIGRLRLQPLRLSTNFRSAAGLVDWVNAVFARLLPAHEDLSRGAVPFAPATHWHPADAAEAVVLHAFVGGDGGEPQRVLELIEAARAASPQTQVAVLVRSRSHLADIVPRLRAAGIPLRAVEIESLGGRPIVQDLLALTRAIVHPADRIAWLAVLRAPWCGLTLADLHALCADSPEALLWTLMTDVARQARLSADGRARLAHAVRALQPPVEAARRASLRATVEAAWLRLAGPDCACETRDLDDARAFLELLEAVERAADLPSVAQLARAVERLFAAPAPLPADAVPVDVMTIHKAKGLAFDVVIVPRLGRRPRSDRGALLAWRELPRADGAGGTDLLLGAIAAAGAAADPVHAYAVDLQRERARLESVRLLYVAATRARRRLHLLGATAIDGDGALKAPPTDSLLAVLWPVARPEFEAARARADAGSVPPAGLPPGGELRRLPAAALRDPTEALAAAVPLTVPTATAQREPLPEFSWAGETVRHVGTVVHRWLQRISLDLARWDEPRLRAARDAIGRELAALGVPESERDGALARALAALAGSLSDARGRWLLGAQRAAASELRLTGIDRGELVDVVIDRTFIDADGVRWVIDYKTGTHEGGAPDAFLDRERERYRPQLERYARLLRALGPEPVRCGLYFPMLGGWREWAAGDGDR